MPSKYLSARVPEDLKRQVKLIAAQKDQTVQDFLGEVVIGYLSNSSQSSRVEGLSMDKQTIVNSWADALLAHDEAALNIYKLMEMWYGKTGSKKTKRSAG